MNRSILTFLTVLSCVALLLSGCEKEEEDDTTTEDGVENMASASVDGVALTPATGTVLPDGGGVQAYKDVGDSWQINAGVSGEWGINISMETSAYNGVGTYDIGEYPTAALGRYINSTSSAITTDVYGGTLVITSDDGTTVSGTFEYQCYVPPASANEIYSITNGTFTAKYLD